MRSAGTRMRWGAATLSGAMLVTWFAWAAFHVRRLPYDGHAYRPRRPRLPEVAFCPCHFLSRSVVAPKMDLPTGAMPLPT
jgi:hypothetical protein